MPTTDKSKVASTGASSKAKADAPAAKTRKVSKDSPAGLPNATLFGMAPYAVAAKEQYMSAAMLDHFMRILNAWKLELMQEVDRTVNHMKDESAAMADINDRATQEEEFAIELRTRDRERKLLRKIESTFKLIDEGDYGYCEVCGIEIGLRRLEARPTATMCIDCKSLAEIKEKQEKG